MQAIHKLLGTAAAAALLACAAVAPSSASPVQIAQDDACGTFLRGTITQVFAGRQFAMHVDNRKLGSIHVNTDDARIDARGHRISVGTYAGVTGCFTNGMRGFDARQITLASSESAFLNERSNTQYAYDRDNGNGTGPCHVSLFGYVTQMWNNGSEFTLQTQGTVGSIHVYDNGTRMNTNGLTLHNGVYTGVYGCFIKNEQAFHANEMTLAVSPAAYSSMFHPTVALTGYVDEVGRGWIGVRTRYYGHVHVITNQTNVRVGETVSIQGTYNANARQIDANTIAVL